MKWNFLILFTLSLIFLSSFSTNDSSVFLPTPVEAKIYMIPVDAVWISLTSLEPEEKYSLAEFCPDQSFIGRYNIKIDCSLYLEDHSPTCSVVCRNLWNSSDPRDEMSTNDSFHKTYTYSYSQPTIEDPDFSIQLKLKTETEITSSNPVEGWILLSVDDYGVTERPEDFTMPTPVDASATTTETGTTGETETTETGTTGETETTNSNSKQQVSFTGSFLCFLSLAVIGLWKKRVK